MIVDDRHASPVASATTPVRAAPRRRLLTRLVIGTVKYVLPLAAVAGGGAGAYWLIKTAPTAERRPPEKQATLVEVAAVSRGDVNAIVQVMGSVMPAATVLLQPRVSGEVVKLSRHFVPGGRFAASEFILQIDPKDYELAVERTRSQVVEAEYALKLEAGHQEIAKREWELLNMQEKSSELDRELALRKPHLLKAEAALEAAKAALRDAELDLERTTVRAPFNCMVVSETIDLGAQVTLQTQLGTLVGTDEYWIQAAVPVDQLHWIRFPGAEGEGGSPAIIRQELGTGAAGTWRGIVVRLLGDLEPQGRMARVLISVPEPLDPNGSDGARIPLLLDAYVNVEIEGRRIEDVVTLPRTALRENGQVWVMNTADQLELRKAHIVWRNRDTVLLRGGIEEGERLVVSDLPAPVAGMALALRETTSRVIASGPGGDEAAHNQSEGSDGAR